MTRYLLYLILIVVFLILSPLLPWPDIPQAVFDFPIQASQQIYYFNTFVAINELLTAVLVIVGIEFAIWLWKIISTIIHGHKDNKDITDHV